MTKRTGGPEPPWNTLVRGIIISFAATAIHRLMRRLIYRSTRRQCGVAKTLTAIIALLVLRYMVLYGTGTGFYQPRRTKQLILNHRYVMDARHVCRMPHGSTQGPDLVILVVSTAERREHRDAIRETYGSFAHGKAWPGYDRETADTSGEKTMEGRPRESAGAPTLCLVFLLGQAKTPSLRLQESQALQLENAQFGDLVQWEDLEEDYFNLTYKVLLGLRWVRHFCSSARLVGKVDDNTFIHMPRLFRHLQNNRVSSPRTPVETQGLPAECYAGYRNKSADTAEGWLETGRDILPDDENIIYGDICIRCDTLREGKYAVSYSMFPFVYYPDYAGGNLYFMSTSLAFRILCVSQYFPYHSMEDVFVTGILGYVVGARHHAFTVAQFNPRATAKPLEFHYEEKIATNDVTHDEFRVIWEILANRSVTIGH